MQVRILSRAVIGMAAKFKNGYFCNEKGDFQYTI
jgi:hypothetical protein